MAEGDNSPTMDTKPPASVRGMKTLDKDAFKMTMHVPCFKLPARQINTAMKNFKKYSLRLPGIKPVAELDQNDQEKETHKLFLLKPEVLSEREVLTTEDKEFLKSCGVDTQSFK